MTTISMDGETITVDFASSIPPLDGSALDRLVRELIDLREVTAALKLWEGELTEVIAEMVGRNTVEVDGVGPVMIKRGTDRKEWDRRALVRAVLDSHRKPNPDGELDGTDEGRAEVSGEAISCSPDLSRVLDVWNLGAPRVTVLRERGIDPDEFCEATPGSLRVVVG